MFILFLLISISLGIGIIRLLNYLNFIEFKQIKISDIYTYALSLGFLFITIYMLIISIFSIPLNRITIWGGILLFTFILNILFYKNSKINLKINFEKFNILDIFIVIIIMYICTYAISNRPFLPDEFSHWAIQAKNIFLGGKLDFFVDTGFESYPNYIPQLASSYYFFIGWIDDYTIRIISSLHLIILIIAFYKVCAELNISIYISRILILLFISSTQIFFDLSSSFYADIIYCCFYSLSIMYFVLWVKNEKKNDFCFSVVYLMGASWIKTDGLFLLIGQILVLCIINFIKYKKVKLKSIIIYTLGSIWLIILWKFFIKFKDLPDSRWILNINIEYIKPMIISILKESFSPSTWLYVNILFLMSLIFNIKKIFKPINLTIIMVICGNIIFLAISYILLFGEEALTAASYSRYITRIVPLQLLYIGVQYTEIKKNNERYMEDN